MEGLGLYIHIPFCKSKCFYCDFNSYSGKEYLEDEYVASVIEEIEKRKTIIKDYKISSIYIGGGTPTYLNMNALCKLVSYLKQFVHDGIEYSCEANPGTLSYEKLMLLKENGINRLSIGLQSFNDDILKKIGRIHNTDDFLKNYHNAREVGFDNINIDIMFAIQGQSLDDFEDTLDKVVSLKPEHISCYSLIIEEGTLFWKLHENGELKEFDEDIDREMYYLATQKLKDAGFLRYEISNFAKIGYECRHNIIYWKTKPYLGIGAGAHSFIKNKRFSNEPNIEKYISTLKSGMLPVVFEERLSDSEMMSEFMFMGLRMMEGIDILEFEKRFGYKLYDRYGMEIQSLLEKGLIKAYDGRIALTDRGIDVSNQVFVEFIK